MMYSPALEKLARKLIGFYSGLEPNAIPEIEVLLLQEGDQVNEYLFVTGLAGLCYAVIRSNERLQSNPELADIRNHCHGLYRINQAMGVKIFNTFRQLSETFAEQGISSIPLKGLRYATLLYDGDFGIRQTSDLDLLVQEKDWRAIDEICTTKFGASGRKFANATFSILPLLRRLWKKIYTTHEIETIEVQSTSVDFHRHLFPKSRFSLYNQETTWRKAIKSEYPSVFYLTCTMELVFCLAVTWKNMVSILRNTDNLLDNKEKVRGYFRLLSHMDFVKLVVLKHNYIDWNLLYRDMRQFGVVREIGGLFLMYLSDYPALLKLVPDQIISKIKADIAKDAEYHTALLALYEFTYSMNKDLLTYPDAETIIFRKMRNWRITLSEQVAKMQKLKKRGFQ